MTIAFKRKACATCTYWNGPRKVNPFKNGVSCDRGSTMGTCANLKSSFKNKQTKAEYASCSKYERWNALSG